MPASAASICGACQQRPPAWDTVVAAAWYTFPVRQLIQQFKFRRNLAAGKVLATLLSQRLVEARCTPPDLVVPVPLHAWRLFRRGFNQSYDIARQVSRDFGLVLHGHGLRKARHTSNQAGLDAGQRRRNLDQAFAWRADPLAGQCVALVDDVMTTGATVGECSRVLRAAGAARILVWVLARAPKPA